MLEGSTAASKYVPAIAPVICATISITNLSLEGQPGGKGKGYLGDGSGVIYSSKKRARWRD